MALAFYSPEIPYYLDADTVCDIAFGLLEAQTPVKSGNMKSYNDYERTGNHYYAWNDCEYGEYQDELVGKDGHKAAYYHWWTDGAPHTFERAIELVKSEALEGPDWLQKVVEDNL